MLNRKPNDLTDCLRDSNGATGYELRPNGVVEVYVSGESGTAYISFNSLSTLRLIHEGLGRIVNKEVIDGSI